MKSDRQNGMLSAMPESSDARIRISFKHVLFGFFIAGYYGLLTTDSYPSDFIEVFQWSSGMILLLPALGALLCAFLLILLSRMPYRPEPLILILFMSGSLVAAFLFVILWFVPTNLPVAFCALVLSGVLMPVGFMFWAATYKMLSFRHILFNSALAFVVYAFAGLASQQLFPQFSLVLNAVFLAIGYTSLLLHKDSIAMAQEGRGHSVQAEPSDSPHSLLPFLVALPIAGIALYSATNGLTFAMGDPPLVNEAIAVCIAATLFLIFVATRISRLPERRASFLLYGIGLPSLAVAALFIKVIPIDFISYDVFREFNMIYFQVLSLAAWTFSVSTLRNTNSSPAFIAGLVQVVICVMLLLGYLIQSFESTWTKGFLGMLTAAFLLYAIIVLGRNIILYSKGPDPDEDLKDNPESIESNCEAIGDEYKLSPREIEVLKELSYGHASSYVAKVLCISNNTARSHMKNIYKKLGISSREELIKVIWKR